MSIGFDDCIVGGQLRVGTGYCAPIKEGDLKINGSAHMEGPVVVGLGSKIKLGAKRSSKKPIDRLHDEVAAQAN